MKKFFLLSISFLLILGGFFSLYQANSLQQKQLKNIKTLGGDSSKKIESHTVELVVGGDIMLSRGIGRWAKQEGYGRTFSGDNYNPLSQFFCYNKGTCLLFFNLESMFSLKDNDRPEGGFLFRSNTGNLQFLLDLKKNNTLALSLANNHTNNAGADGVMLTRELLSNANIGFMGAGATTGDAEKLYVIKKNDILFCFQSFSYDGTHGQYGGKPLARNPLNFNIVDKTLKNMKDMGCEVKIIVPHWGAEYHLHPAKWQRELAYKIIDAGADIILGGHSHVPGSYEYYQGKRIFYSFGNFMFDQEWGKRAQERNYDYIYDSKLKRKTVPTYIPLLVGLKITKQSNEIKIGLPEFKMTRIDKGIYSPIDDETAFGILSKAAFTD